MILSVPKYQSQGHEPELPCVWMQGAGMCHTVCPGVWSVAMLSDSVHTRDSCIVRDHQKLPYLFASSSSPQTPQAHQRNHEHMQDQGVCGTYAEPGRTSWLFFDMQHAVVSHQVW